MLVEERPIEEIRGKPLRQNNPRHNESGIDAVAAASIEEFGFRQPIVVDEQGVIVVGHTRFKAALKLGMKSVPVHVARGLTPAQIRAYRIADNQTATLSSWDDDLLIAELTALQKEDYDLDMTGFSADELMEMMRGEPGEGLTDPDDVPEPPDEAFTKPGDLWILGNHRLLCGDSSKAEDVDRLLDGAVIHLVNSDPPYNVRVEPFDQTTRLPPAFPASGSQEWAKNHQGFDVARDKSKRHAINPGSCVPRTARSRTTSVSDAEFEKLLLAWFGLELRACTGARARFLHLGRVREFRELSAGFKRGRTLLLSNDHLEQSASRPNP